MRNQFTLLDDNNETIGTADTLSAVRDLLDQHVKNKYGDGYYRLGMRNYGPRKDEAGLYSEMLELKLDAYSTRAFLILMPAGWTPKDWTL